MIISEKKLGREYQAYCEAKGIRLDDPESTKAFTKAWMQRRGFTMIKKEGNYYRFK